MIKNVKYCSNVHTEIFEGKIGKYKSFMGMITQSKRGRAARWLNGQSDFFTKLLEESVSRRDVLLVNAAFACMIIAAVAANVILILSVFATLCALFFVWLLTMTE